MSDALAVQYRSDQNNFPNPESGRRNNMFHYYQTCGYMQAVDDAHRPDFPYVCTLEFTNRCNLDCVFCARQVMTRTLGNLDEHLLHKMMEEFAQRRIFVKVNGYGENLLHPQALDFIRHIKKTNPLYFTTNATVMNDRVAECLVESDLDVLQISFQGVDRAGYESQRRRGSFDRLCANLDRLVAIRGNHPYPYIHLSTTILDETSEQIERFIDFAFQHGADCVGIGRTDYDRVVADMVSDPDRKALIQSFRQRQTLEQVPDHTYLYRYCDITWSGVAVSSFFDFNAFVPVGDLSTHTMYEIWNYSPSIRALRILERRRVLRGVGEVREALDTLSEAGVADKLGVFDTFYHAWQLGRTAYNT